MGELLPVGGAIDRVHVSLRVLGADLDPDEISRMLGAAPTKSHRRGGVRRSRRSGKTFQHRQGLWLLESGLPESTPLAEQIQHVLRAMSDDLAVWSAIHERFEIDMHCGLFLDDFNRGTSIPPTTLRMLADRHVELGLDIYGYVESGTSDDDDEALPPGVRLVKHICRLRKRDQPPDARGE